LPAYRGAAPINHALLRGDARTGVTVIRMAERIDAGEILASQPVDIDPDWNALDLADALAPVGASLMARTLRDVEDGRAQPAAQDRAKVSLAPKFSKDDGIIPWEKSARGVHNHVRGMTPWPGAFTFVIDGRSGARRRVAVLKTTVAETEMGTGKMGTVPILPPLGLSPFSPGTVISAGPAGLVVACGAGSVRVERVKPAGSREMSADDFARGHGMKTGSRFTGE
jgi:methionyl-tRNA formyltransferase